MDVKHLGPNHASCSQKANRERSKMSNDAKFNLENRNDKSKRQKRLQIDKDYVLTTAPTKVLRYEFLSQAERRGSMQRHGHKAWRISESAINNNKCRKKTEMIDV